MHKICIKSSFETNISTQMQTTSLTKDWLCWKRFMALLAVNNREDP